MFEDLYWALFPKSGFFWKHGTVMAYNYFGPFSIKISQAFSTDTAEYLGDILSI
jgi:hypothetical protein